MSNDLKTRAEVPLALGLNTEFHRTLQLTVKARSNLGRK